MKSEMHGSNNMDSQRTQRSHKDSNFAPAIQTEPERLLKTADLHQIGGLFVSLTDLLHEDNPHYG